MRYRLLDFNKHRQRKGKPIIETGIGINTGPTIIGTIGSNDRMDSTVIGDSVNLASRLENLNKLYKTNIIISGFTYDAIKNKDEYFIREIDKAVVKGKNIAVKIYEVFDPDLKKIKQLKLNYMDDYYNALSFYREKQWHLALKIFQRLFEINKNDYVLKVYIDRCISYIKNPPIEWDGAVKFDFK